MDRLTQLQDAIDKMALLFVSSLDHLTKNAPLVPLHPNVPVVSTGTIHLLPPSFLSSLFGILEQRQLTWVTFALVRIDHGMPHDQVQSKYRHFFFFHLVLRCHIPALFQIIS